MTAPIAPGGEGRVQLVLERPIAAAVGDRFIVRDTTAQRTIGGGAFLDLRAPARRRRTPERLAQLAACAIVDHETALARMLDAPPLFVDLTGFARDRAIEDAEAEAIAERLGVARLVASGVTYALSAATWQGLKAELIALLREISRGKSRIARNRA